MKYFIVLIMFMVLSTPAWAQRAGIGTPSPDPSALLDISSTGKGLLIPRMNSLSMLSIPAPAKGLLLYDSVANQIMVNTGTAAAPHWQSLLGNNGWSLKGNGGTDPAVNFIGTTDDKPLLFKVNNQWSGQIDSTTATTSFGYMTGKNNAQTYGNTTFGCLAMGQDVPNQGSNTALGFQALYLNRTGSFNTAIGCQAMMQNTTGSCNTANGYLALNNSTTGSYNTALGWNALGDNSGYVNTGNYNTAIGYWALTPNTGNYNTAVGGGNGYVGIGGGGGKGSGNTLVGSESMTNTQGSYNTVGGYSCLQYLAQGDYNTVLGDYSLDYKMDPYISGSTHVSETTAIGFGTLQKTDGAVNAPAVDASGNTVFGCNAANYSYNGQHNVFIGANVDITNGSVFNSVVMGQGTTTAVSNTVIFGNGATSSIGGPVDWTVLSDGRVKKNIRENKIGLSFITRLRPVTYTINPQLLDSMRNAAIGIKTPSADSVALRPVASPLMAAAYRAKEKILYSGFVAQEVEQLARNVNTDFDGVDAPKAANDLYALRYESFVMPLVNSVQELAAQNKELVTSTAALKSAYQNMNERLDALEKKIK